MPSSLSSRRRFLAQAGAAALVARPSVQAALRPAQPHGHVVGDAFSELAGAKVLADGGNAVDALVVAALVGAVTQPHQTGVGGYAAHGIVAMDGGRRIVVIDANTTAPAAATADMFRPDAKGQVVGRRNHHGWLSAGVPGVMAGLHLALKEFGTLRFSDALQPAIALTAGGVTVTPALAGILGKLSAGMRADPGSAALYLPGGVAPKAGEKWRNPALAEVLRALARAESAEPLYRGDLALRMGESFARNGGLVTARDLAAYRARLVEPLRLEWDGRVIHTPPLTSGGITVLQTLALLRALGWEKIEGDGPRALARVEALRLAWRDRLALLGDPDFGPVPQARLLSADYAGESAERVRAALKAGRSIDHRLKNTPQGGTLSFSAGDRHGNMAALTLTHGDSFGAQVTVGELGLTLGHGMSRFETDFAHPNAPGPGKRPLHNMAPVILTAGGKAIAAVGGRGGRRIPNAVLDLLLAHVVERRPFAEALAAPRLHTEGALAVEHEKGWPAAATSAWRTAGLAVKTGSSATLSAVAMEDGAWRAGMR
ncbi:MAG: gamma-glutamyltransferase [Opitutaceae bacterium]|jgi:gamma-glutamyltranspeptidase/glutathione hydrolase|nr:gamma-glutamyltransferase [Opitutaceae bacterium]